MRIRKAAIHDMKQALAITKELKKWFTKEAVENMKIDFKLNNLIVALDRNRVLGFLCYPSEHGTFKIMWMGVARKYHRKSVGSSLLSALIKKAKKLKSKAIRLETLPDEDNYKPYKMTRDFYYKHGFKRIYYKKAVKRGWDDQIVMEKKLK